jgi:hypothetical protein
MSLVTEEIESAVSKLGLEAADIQHLSAEENKRLYGALVERFVNGGDRRWWWESFNEEEASHVFKDGMGFKRIPELVPDANEKLWFVVEEDQLEFYPIYETTAEVVSAVVGECYAFEYYLIPKDTSWLICENHHNRIIGVGNSVIKKLGEVAV